LPTAKEVTCTVIKKEHLTPTIIGLSFEPSKKFTYEAGQFLSIIVPKSEVLAKAVKRAYSFSSPDALSGYELCVKHVPGGLGSSYVAALKEGDTFKAFAPYGDFRYSTSPLRAVCFVATGSGVAPFRGIALSREFRENPPKKSLLLFGARNEEEILYRGSFEHLGIEVVHSLSKPTPFWGGHRGYVTDYLKVLPHSWNWHGTDFYICGNGAMAVEVTDFLRQARGVSANAIHSEIYFSPVRAPLKKVA